MQNLHRINRRLTPLFAIAIVLLFTAAVTACPTCKQGLAENDPSYQGMVSGYFYSILFMMSMPFLIIGTFGGLAYLSIRRAQAAQTTAAQSEITEGT